MPPDLVDEGHGVLGKQEGEPGECMAAGEANDHCFFRKVRKAPSTTADSIRVVRTLQMAKKNTKQELVEKNQELVEEVSTSGVYTVRMKSPAPKMSEAQSKAVYPKVPRGTTAPKLSEESDKHFAEVRLISTLTDCTSIVSN